MSAFLMRAAAVLAVFVVCLAWSGGHAQAKTRQASCTPTGYMQDNINLTAAVVITTSGAVANQTIDATGCNIGVYFAPGSSGVVVNSEIFGANYYGVLVDAGNVTVVQSRIHDIHENPFNGTQHGEGVRIESLHSSRPAFGRIIGNQISAYQKNGIVVNGPLASAFVMRNAVAGQGPTPIIAQNGIEVGRGARATVTQNTVQGNSFTGPTNYVATGILVFGGPCFGAPFTTGTTVIGNTATGNDVGVYLANLESDCVSSAATPTQIMVSQNTLRNDAVTNTSGARLNTPPPNLYPYQAGVTDVGNRDSIVNNRICGAGYTPPPLPPPFLYTIDITYAISPSVANNTTCSGVTIMPPQWKAQKSKAEPPHISVRVSAG
ncbi:MAG: hypothetical protein IMW89_01565 [Ktedonobacteraceae bacterium]|nr:hypothetical protein [Ktedonobacteraceae bacterium]